MAFSQRYVEGEVIVKFKNRQGIQALNKFMGKPGHAGKLSLKKSWSSLKLHHFKVNGSESVEQTVDDLRGDPDVEYAEPNWFIEKFDVPNPGNDNIYSEADVAAQAQAQAGGGGSVVTTAPIQYQQSWAIISNNSNKPVVAIIDTGVDLTHTVFTQSGAIWTNPGEIPNNGIDDDGNGYVDDVHGWNFVSDNNNPNDDEGHGTHVAGTILGMSQDIFTAPYAAAKIQIMPLKFLDSTGYGSTSDAIQAIYYASNNGAKILNNSWGGPGYSQSLKDAIAYSYTKKTLFVAAAGNSNGNNDSNPMYPASYDVPNIISTAASTPSDYKAYFSNYGAASVHVASPGTSIFSTWPGGTWKYSDGTSMATPIVSGIAAMMLHEQISLTGYQIKSLIFTASDIKSQLNNQVSTKSRINAYNSIYSAKSGGSLPSDPVYQSSSPLTSRDVASAVTGSCGTVHKMNGNDNNFPGFGNWSPTNNVLIIILIMPMLVSLLLRRSPAELRRHERFNIRSAVTLVADGKEFIGEVSSISLGGVKLDTGAMLKDGGVVTMSIASPDGKESVQVQGKIVWSEANKHYGVQFANADQSMLSRISVWTKSLVKAS